MNSIIDSLKWRYATKKFDASKKISAEHLAIIKEALQLSASSYGLQPYQFIFVENPALRAQLQPAAWGQSQIVDASHLLVLANEINLNEKHIDAYFENMTKTRGIALADVQGYSDFMKSKITPLSEETRNIWTSKQTYIALGKLLTVAASLEIDATPMEGFEPAEFNRILGLTERGLNASLVVAIGYRHADDATQHYTKVRKPAEELFITL